MELIRKEDTIFSDMVAGELELSVYLSDADYDEPLFNTIEQWGKGDKETCITTAFKLSDILETAIDLNKLIRDKDGAIDAHQKPLFDAMKTELEQMLERINKLTFK